jgi:hypothetical protein
VTLAAHAISVAPSILNATFIPQLCNASQTKNRPLARFADFSGAFSQYQILQPTLSKSQKIRQISKNPLARLDIISHEPILPITFVTLGSKARAQSVKSISIN